MRKEWLWALGFAGAGVFSVAQGADTGVYLGGSLGQSQISQDVEGPGVRLSFDEHKDAWKVFAGARFGLLGVEGGYVDFGNPKVTVLGTRVDANLTGYDLFGMLNMDVGPATLFAKAGAISWNADVDVGGISVDSDGTDPAYGVGASFKLTDSLRLRAEYELFDVSDLNDLNMWSAGLQYTF